MICVFLSRPFGTDGGSVCLCCSGLAAALCNCTWFVFTEVKQNNHLTVSVFISSPSIGDVDMSRRNMESAQRYRDKVAIVTGGSKGIGRGIVKVFGKFGSGAGHMRGFGVGRVTKKLWFFSAERG